MSSIPKALAEAREKEAHSGYMDAVLQINIYLPAVFIIYPNEPNSIFKNLLLDTQETKAEWNCI